MAADLRKQRKFSPAKVKAYTVWCSQCTGTKYIYTSFFIFAELFSLFGHFEPHLQPSTEVHMPLRLYIEAMDQLYIGYNITYIYRLFVNYTAWKWWLEEKNHDLAPELVAYALMQSFSQASHQCGHDSLSPIAVCKVMGGPQYCDPLGPVPEGSVRWCAQRAACMCMCMSLWARGGWWCTVPISICVVSKCYASWCNLYKLSFSSGMGPKWLQYYGPPVTIYTAIGDEESWPHWWLAWLKLCVRA